MASFGSALFFADAVEGPHCVAVASAVETQTRFDERPLAEDQPMLGQERRGADPAVGQGGDFFFLDVDRCLSS